jgi:hypothetical protein
MNAVEIEEAVSRLVEQPFDPNAFPFAFLEAFGNKETTLKKLKSGNSNKSDLPDSVLQRNNIHLKVCAEGEVHEALEALRQSSATTRQKAKFILATDGNTIEAENLADEESPLVCNFVELSDHFGYFLPLAGITTVRQIRENAFDIKATGRLNKLYIELLRENPDWDTEARRQEMNHFMARLIFCFFAEDTDIFHNRGLFTATIDQMSERNSSNTHEVLSELFRAMNTKLADRESAKIRSWANVFPYVNGGLFSDSVEVPRFSKIGRSYLLHVGRLDWTKINPDIFGSMIQAVADDEERGNIGMHYTSVPNILKVLNPLFLDDLRARLEETGDNARKLLNLRQRIARIRVFDPACGSGNFLVIAYKQMREIEAEINHRRGEADRRSDIPLTNFRGIEIRHFSCEIARLALIIAEYQCDVIYRGQQLALAEFLPLEAANWITQGNALQIDWASVCRPEGTVVRLRGDDLFSTPLDQSEIDFENEGGEIYICGNPPYLGSTWQSPEQKAQLKQIFEDRTKTWGSLDYVAGWFMKAADFGMHHSSVAAFVATNSICQGQQVPFLWPLIFATGQRIAFAHTSFKWANLASHNAGVTVVIVGLSRRPSTPRRLFTEGANGDTISKEVANITAYLVGGSDVIVKKAMYPLTEVSVMDFGNKADDGGYLTLTAKELQEMHLSSDERKRFIKRFFGSKEFINGETRYCMWIKDDDLADAREIHSIDERIEMVRSARRKSKDAYAQSLASRPHQFKTPRLPARNVIITPRVSSENRPYLPVGYLTNTSVIGDRNFAVYDAPLWNMALIASRLHWVWIGTVCVRMRTDFSYSNTLGWNTFPVPTLTEQNKADLTHCAEDILLVREAHFPATIADLYDPETMPANLRAAHERNDETLERIYIGRRFKNDTERLEKLFELYTQMTARQTSPKKPTAHKKKTADA